jgi:hypothetical protein
MLTILPISPEAAIPLPTLGNSLKYCGDMLSLASNSLECHQLYWKLLNLAVSRDVTRQKPEWAPEAFE